MSGSETFELVLFVVALLVTAKPLGIYLDKVFRGERTFLSPVFGWLERRIYRAADIDPDEDQHWTRYAFCLLVFSAVGCLLPYLILRFQAYLPLNPQNWGAVGPDLSFNTAVSFTTNTNWQSYPGETTMSYFSQMVGLVVHNFSSAAVGMAVAIALIRGIVRKEAKGIGNFWADLVRGHLYVLLPGAFVIAVLLLSQGMIQTFGSYVEATTLEGV